MLNDNLLNDSFDSEIKRKYYRGVNNQESFKC